MKWFRRFRVRLRRAILAGQFGWRVSDVDPDRYELVMSAQLVSKRLIEDGNDRAGHLLGGYAYKSVLRAFRERAGTGPDRHISRTTTFA